MSGLIRRKRLKQVVMAVESDDRSFRWIGAMGESAADGTPIRRTTPFFIASIDKLFNAVVVMKLREEGKIDIDAPIGDYLRRSLTAGLHSHNGADYTDRITVRHLLGHTSGLPDWLEDASRGGRSLVERVLHDGDRALGIEDIADVVRELRPHFPPQDPIAERPKIRYSDTNYILLVAIIEAVAGKPLHEVHESLLFRPLDMRHTYFSGRSQPIERTPSAVVLRFEGRPLAIPLLLRSLWGMYSTAEDVLIFLRSFVSGAIFRDSSTPASMQARWNRFGLPFDRAALRAPSWPIEYGLGIMRFRLPRILSPLRPMPAVIGHTGSTGCWLFSCPKIGMLFTGSVDEVTAGALPYRLVPRMITAVRALIAR
jgi:CubicO group peptidase (beta-lactamase class C family)